MPTLIDVYFGVLETGDIHKLPINKAEVEKLLEIPISYFINTEPDLYKIDSWSSPYRVDKNGNKKFILPSKDLKLPKKYHSQWNGKTRKVIHYPDLELPLWGVTADIIYRFINDYKTKFER